MANRRPPQAARNPFHFKLVLLGDEGVGKSCIAQRFVRRQFNDHSSPTIGGGKSRSKKSVCDTNDENRKVKLDIWDTAGQERYHSLAPIYYRGASAAVVVYDLTRTETYEHAKNWITELRQQAGSDIAIVLAGNKSDMADTHSTVPKLVGHGFLVRVSELCRKNGDSCENKNYGSTLDQFRIHMYTYIAHSMHVK
eukprot:sb/3470926/